jgi:hypothetical protein
MSPYSQHSESGPYPKPLESSPHRISPRYILILSSHLLLSFEKIKVGKYKVIYNFDFKVSWKLPAGREEEMGDNIKVNIMEIGHGDVKWLRIIWNFCFYYKELTWIVTE